MLGLAFSVIGVRSYLKASAPFDDVKTVELVFLSGHYRVIIDNEEEVKQFVSWLKAPQQTEKGSAPKRLDEHINLTYRDGSQRSLILRWDGTDRTWVCFNGI